VTDYAADVKLLLDYGYAGAAEAYSAITGAVYPLYAGYPLRRAPSRNKALYDAAIADEFDCVLWSLRRLENLKREETREPVLRPWRRTVP